MQALPPAEARVIRTPDPLLAVCPAVRGAYSVNTGPVFFILLLFAPSSRAHQWFTNSWWIQTRPSEEGGDCLSWKPVINLVLAYNVLSSVRFVVSDARWVCTISIVTIYNLLILVLILLLTILVFSEKKHSIPHVGDFDQRHYPTSLSLALLVFIPQKMGIIILFISLVILSWPRALEYLALYRSL
jgi:uncharacterized membrane protein